MIAAHCPDCGAVNALSLAEPARLRCVYCGYDGLPPERVRPRLEEASRIALELDQKQLQLSVAQRRSLTDMTAGRSLLLAFLAVLAVPSLAVAISCSTGYAPVPVWQQLLLAFLPIATVVGFGGWSLRQLATENARLEQACAATPPLAPGDSAHCHVCGAPLASDPGQSIARCSFCQADNLVTKQVLDRLREHSRFEFEEFAADLYRETHALQGVPAVSTVRLVAVAIAAPLIAVIAMMALGLKAELTGEGRPNNSIEYVLYPIGLAPDRSPLRQAGSPEDHCIGLERDGVVYLGKVRSVGSMVKMNTPKGGKLETIRASELVGRRVHVGVGEGRIVRVVGEFNGLEIETESGRQTWQSAQGTCLVAEQ